MGHPVDEDTCFCVRKSHMLNWTDLKVKTGKRRCASFLIFPIHFWHFSLSKMIRTKVGQNPSLSKPWEWKCQYALYSLLTLSPYMAFMVDIIDTSRSSIKLRNTDFLSQKIFVVVGNTQKYHVDTQLKIYYWKKMELTSPTFRN